MGSIFHGIQPATNTLIVKVLSELSFLGSLTRLDVYTEKRRPRACHNRRGPTPKLRRPANTLPRPSNGAVSVLLGRRRLLPQGGYRQEPTPG
jgi:hypothetical protein